VKIVHDLDDELGKYVFAKHFSCRIRSIYALHDSDVTSLPLDAPARLRRDEVKSELVTGGEWRVASGEWRVAGSRARSGHR
jgi:hypothetical protein